VPGVDIVANVGVGEAPPVKPVESATISGTERLATFGPENVIVTGVPGSGPPAPTTPPVPMFGSASSAACTMAADALKAIAAVWAPS
jgi:hypothetical protein